MILIVEDHAAVRRSLREWLEAVFPWCHIVEAASGEEAVAAVQVEAPNAVLMDISLPGMNGIEATRRIKAALPATPVVMLTIHEADAYRADALAAGANAYISKRAMHSELIPAVNRSLTYSRKRSQQVIQRT